MNVSVSVIGKVGDVEINSIDMKNSCGMEITCMTYGATLTRVACADIDRNIQNIVLCPELPELLDSSNYKPKYVGTIGRVANRIAMGVFSLDGQDFTLAVNNGRNHLHGGLEGFDKKVWGFELLQEEGKIGVRFLYTSAHMEEGYPGQLTTRAEYWLTESNDIHMKFTAHTDATTPVNITNHACWNLSGDFCEDIKGHTLYMSCAKYLPVDDGLIPTGDTLDVMGTAFDFYSSQSRVLGDAIAHIDHGGVAGVDHSFVVNEEGNAVVLPGAPDCTGLRHVATLTHTGSGRQLIVHSNQPAVQIYTANFLPAAGTVGAELPFCQHYGVCVENQVHPDAVNKQQFPSVLLSAGEQYCHRAVYSLRILEQ